MLRRGRVVLAALALAVSGCSPGQVCDGDVFCLSPETAARVVLRPDHDALAAADLDGDGRLDLVSSGSATGTLTVRWGGDAGPGDRAATWSVGREAGGVAIADLDGDGRLDLATAVPSDDAVAVLRGRGGRSFAAVERYPAGATPRNLITADLDGRGPLELVTADLAGGTVTVLRELVAGPAIVVGAGPRGLAAGDLDGDGDTDLAVSRIDVGAVQVLLGDGAGGLAPGPLHPVGAAPYSLVAADLDDDGALDLATADALDDTISVLFADGAGGHRPREAFPTSPTPRSLVVVRDETSRHVLAALSGEQFVVDRVDPRDGATRSAAVGALDPLGAIAAGEGARIAYAGEKLVGALAPGDGLGALPRWDAALVSDTFPVDLDGDGVDALLVVSSVVGAPLELWRDGPDTAVEVHTGLDGPVLGARAGDLTGDGLRDVVVWDAEALAVLVQEPDGDLRAAAVEATEAIVDVELGDRAGDGQLDVLVFREFTGFTAIEWSTCDAAGELSPRGTSFAAFRALDAHVVDGDGDAAIDLILQGSTSILYLEDGDAVPLEIEDGPVFSGASLEFADLDGDGALDVVACDSVGLSLGSAILDPARAPFERLPGACRAATIADVDGDGGLDLITGSLTRVEGDVTQLTPWRLRDGAWEALGRTVVEADFGSTLRFVGRGAGELPGLVVRTPVLRIRAVDLALVPSLVDEPGLTFGGASERHLGDFDGDGLTDLAFVGDTLAVAFADGRGGLGPLQQRSLADALGASIGYESAVGDLDGDGVDELIVDTTPPDLQGRALQAVSLARDGALSFETVGSLPPGVGALQPADLDGDGVLDLVAFAVDGGLGPYLLAGRGDGRFAAARPTAIVPLSDPSTDLVMDPRLFDVDGDGALDVVADGYIPGTPVTFVFPGRGGGVFAAPYIAATVFELSTAFGDVDGDGRTDFAFRSGWDNSLLLLRGGASGPPRVLLDRISTVATLDVDGDGRRELLAFQPQSGGLGSAALSISRPRDDGRLGFVRRPVPIDHVREIQAGDIDGDGRVDLALFDAAGALVLRGAP